MVQVVPLAAFTDNYIWALINTSNASIYVVDPGDAAPVIDYCEQNKLTLKGILITHHHWDHTDGVANLVATFPDIPVYGPKDSPFKGITHSLADNQELTLDPLQVSFSVMTVPGHTLDHIAYYNQDMIFCGDTLFNGGCGRLFEGTAKQMHHSLSRISELNEQTLVYCTHEYTRANLAFALHIEPENTVLADYHSKLQQHNEISLPTTLSQQAQINPFLRCNVPEVISSVKLKAKLTCDSELSIFTALRELKDNY